MAIVKNSHMPMYIQIAETLKQEIQDNTINPGESIGSQRELKERFGVSQITIRQAINILKEEGFVIIKQGKGTFAKPLKVAQSLVSLQSLSEVICESGYKPDVKILKMEIIPVPKKLQTFFKDASECLYLERIHVVKSKPIAFARIYLPSFIKDQFTMQDFEKNTIYDLYEKRLNIELGEALQLIEACKADAFLANRLQVVLGYPLLKAERTVMSTDGNPIEHIVFYYPYEEYAFKIVLKRVREVRMWPE